MGLEHGHQSVWQYDLTLMNDVTLRQGETRPVSRTPHVRIHQRMQMRMGGGRTGTSEERLAFGPFASQRPRSDWLIQTDRKGMRNQQEPAVIFPLVGDEKATRQL